jgi:hypothetical protein
MFPAQLVIIKEVDKADSHFIPVPQIECFTQVSPVIVLTGGEQYFFIIPEPVLIPEYKPASEPEVPGEERIHIEYIHICILVVDECP